MGIPKILGVLWLASSASAQVLDHAKVFQDSVVIVQSSQMDWDFQAPWRREAAQRSVYMGTVVNNQEILVAAAAVVDASLLEVRRVDGIKSRPAQVVFADYEANLALLKVDDPSDLQPLRPAALGEDMGIQSKAFILKNQGMERLGSHPVVLLNVPVLNVHTGRYSLPHYQLESQKVGLGWSEPVVKGGKLVGMAVGQGENMVYALPAEVIKHFLDDVKSPPYKGFPTLGITSAPLMSEHQRNLLKVPAKVEGVRISKVAEASPFLGDLRQDDILTHVDNISISSRGFFSHPVWGPVHFSQLISHKFSGDGVKLTVVRQGNELKFEKKISRFQSDNFLLPTYPAGGKIPHVVIAGLVFQELSIPYLKEWGRNWDNDAPLPFLQIYHNEDGPQVPPGKRIVILTKVMPDRVNSGYESLANLRISHVNHQTITSLDDLKGALGRPVLVNGKSFTVFDFDRDEAQVVLENSLLKGANERIANQYSIGKESFAAHLVH